MSRITRAYCLFLSRLALGKIAELRATKTPPQSVGLPHDKICQLIVSERTVIHYVGRPTKEDE
jgi:hypothetical protein